MEEAFVVYVVCKNSKLDLHNIELGTITTTDTMPDWGTWKAGFKSKQMTCPNPDCRHKAEYSSDDLEHYTLPDKKLDF